MRAQTVLHWAIAQALALAEPASAHQSVAGFQEAGLVVRHHLVHRQPRLAASASPASAFAWPRFRREI